MTTFEKHEQNVQKLREMIKGIEFAMLTTVDDDGTLRSRPMATQRKEFDGDLYFFTKITATKVHEVEHERNVCVSYAAPEEQRYVSMSGPARLLRDRAKMQELWFPDLETWFPEGLEDPGLALLWISVTQAEYWEGPFGSLVFWPRMKKMAAGAAFERDENEKLDLKGET
jgi:general stress protein 26